MTLRIRAVVGVFALGFAFVLHAASAATADGPAERTIETATIRMRVLEQGEGPLVLLLHGFPDLADSWESQLQALADAGFRAVAPDLRGYGGSEAPLDVEAYDLVELSSDVVALMDALGEEQATIVGHDWGAIVAWSSVLFHPERFRGLVSMGFSYGGHESMVSLANLQAAFGANFFYVLYYQEPGVAEAELDGDPRALFERVFVSPDTVLEPAPITSPRADAGGLLGRLGRPVERPGWLKADQLDRYVETFERTGFRGGLNYYRNIDRNIERARPLAGVVTEVPVLFLAGERDLVLGGATADQLRAVMTPVTRELTVQLLPDAGHWIQRARAAEVNEALLGFLASGEEPEER